MHRRLCSFVLIAGVCIAAIFVPLSSGAAGTSLPSCSTAQLVPTISELSVNQGLPTYTRLARGKEAIVRAYLTLPSSCAATRTQKIEPSSAMLTVNNGSAQVLANAETLTGAIGSAAQISSTADPYFVVPASNLAPANAAAFNATFTLQVTYKRTDGTSVTGGLLTSATATNATKTVPVDKRTNALRVLVLPIGDPTATTTQFSPEANTAIQNMLTAASRAFPVPTGTGDLSPTATGGIRYAIGGGLLDARSLGLYATSGGLTKFCSNATNFGTSLISSGAFAGLTLKGQLQQALSDYNSANPTKPADMVLGAADENSSWASSSGVLCPAPIGSSAGGPDDGRASGPTSFAIGKPSWARVTYNGVSSPGFMEIAHNLGISRPPSVGLHSPNVEADGTAVNRAVNVTQRKVLYAGGALGNDHSAMNYNPTIPYSINNILLEPNDWKDVLCDLGGVDSQIGTAFSACPLGSAPGTAVNVAANVLDVNGTTNGTDARVTNSFTTSLDTGLQTVEDFGSNTRLLLRAGTCAAPGSTLLDYGLPVERDNGHSDGSITGDSPGAANAFHGLVPFAVGTTTVQVLVNNSVKYCRSATGAPDVTDTTVQPLGAAGQLLRSFANPVAGGGRGMAFDGETLWTSLATGTDIYQVSTAGSLLRTVDVGHTIGALAYDPGNGHLYGGNYNPTTGGTPDDGKIYDITTGADPTTNLKFQFDVTGTSCRGGELGAIDGLELLPSGGFAISGDAGYTLFLTNASGGQTGSFGVSCNSGITTDGAGGLWRVDLNSGCCGNPSTIVHSDLAGNQLGTFTVGPNYEPEDIAYDSVTFAPQCALWMNEAGIAAIRAYSVPCGGATPPATSKAVTFTATGGDLVGTAYVTCGGDSPKYPVADSLTPVDTEAAVKSFSFAFTSTLSCGNGGNATVITTVSNGLYQSSLTDANATQTFDSTDKPPAPAIAAPVNDASFGAGSKIAYNGSGFDAEEGALSSDQSLTWFLDGNQIGTGRAFDLPAPAAAGPHTVRLVATDTAGTAFKEVTIRVDGTPPLLAMSPGASAGSTASENVTASDDIGLANVFCSVDALPAPLNPTPTGSGDYSGYFTYSAGLVHQLSCTALDRAGNQTTVNAISQFAPASVSCVGAPGRTVLQPVNPDGSSVFKKGGSTVPVKFRVCDAGGNSIGPSQVVDFQRATPPAGCTATPTPTARRVPVLCKKEPGIVGGVDEAVVSTNPDTSFRWSSADRVWVFNLATSNLASGSKYTYYIPLIDDTNIFFAFGVK